MRVCGGRGAQGAVDAATLDRRYGVGASPQLDEELKNSGRRVISGAVADGGDEQAWLFGGSTHARVIARQLQEEVAYVRGTRWR
jgi:hypothetical protein